MALGAIEALESNAMLKSTAVFGIDANTNGLAAVRKGTMTATIAENMTAQGSRAIEACVQIANGQDVPKEIIVDHTIINTKTIETYQIN
jgi:ABC-type sugar transport system substrate-binding protein